MPLSRTATLRLQLLDGVSGPSKGIAGALKGMDGSLKSIGKNASPELQKMIKKLEELKKAASTANVFQQTARDSKEMRRAFQEARNEVSKLQHALKQSPGANTGKLKQDLKTAQQVMKDTAKAWRDQITAKKEAERAFNSLNLGGFKSGQQKIRDEIQKTRDAIKKQIDDEKKLADRKSLRQDLKDATIGVAGTTGVYYGAQGARNAFDNAVEMDKVTRYQAAIAGLTPDQQKPLTEQAMRIGKDTRFTNPDAVLAQTGIIQKGVRDPKIVLAMMDSITDYALAMGTTLEEAVETVHGGMLSKGKDLSDPKTTANNTRDFVNYLVNMAKRGGMNDDDVRQYLKYSGSPTTTVGLPDDLTAAMAILLRRGGLRGDEAGVFGRALAGKLVAPTNKGRDAMAAMGIDYDSFAKMGPIDLQGIETMMKQKFGKQLTDDMREQIRQVVEEGTFIDSDGEEMPITADRGRFTTAISDIVNPLFAGKNGKVAASDSKAVAKAFGDYHKYSVDNVDVVGLLDAIMSKNPTFAQLEALFTNRQSGRAAVLANRWDQVNTERGIMRSTPSNLAHRIGKEANSGMYGDFTRMKGSFETLFTTIGQDWEFAIRPIMTTISDVVDGFNELDPNVRRLAEAATAAAVALAGLAAANATRNLLGRLFGGVAAGAAGGVVGTTATTATTAGTAATAGTLGALIARFRWLASPQGALLAAGVAGVGLLRRGRADEDKLPPLKDYSQDYSQSENATRNYKQWHGVQFEGGMHRAGRGAGPKAGQVAADLKDKLSVEAEPTLDTAALMQAAANARAHLKQMLSVSAEVKAYVRQVVQPAAATPLGHKRAGGPVLAGRDYIVGEEGPERLTMGKSGYVTPTRKLADEGGAHRGMSQVASTGQPITNHNIFNIRSNDTKEVVAAVSRILDRQLVRSRLSSTTGRPVTT